jgi:hypothetical protein
MTNGYRLYGDFESRETIVLTSVMMAKGLSVDFVEEAPSLSYLLEARSGQEQGPYLRTPDGFVLGGLHRILDWLDRMHPERTLLPQTPVRRICARLLEDWIDYWLPLWPRRSWETVGSLGRHLSRSGCLLGRSPTRPDWLLAAWLEADVLGRSKAHTQLASVSPGLLTFAEGLLVSETSSESVDAIPISLLAVLEELASDYHLYLALNQRALKDHGDRVVMDLGLGKWGFPVRRECEIRRLETAEELKAMCAEERHAVRGVLEPVGAWHALTLPSALEEMSVSDPRSL